MTATLDVFLELGAPGARAGRERGGAVVVVDALRASATIVCALAAGMRRVRVVESEASCAGDVTAGERDGEKLPGLDYGNSPTEILGADHRGAELCLTTTNGAGVLSAAAGGAAEVLVGTTLNATACAGAAARLARERGGPVTLVSAGRRGGEAIEDALAAGVLLGAIEGARLRSPAPPSAADLERAFLASDAGKNLVSIGYERDVRLCARVDLYDLVPRYEGGALVPR